MGFNNDEDVLKKEIVSVVRQFSHDMRSPIVTINMGIELTLKFITNPNNIAIKQANIEKLLKNALIEAERLGKIIDKLENKISDT